MKKLYTMFLVLAILTFGFGAVTFADNEATAGDYAAGMGTQFGRGLLNIVTSSAEIPCTMRDDIESKGGAVGTFTGFGKGLAFFVRRAVIGVCEVGTFFMPAPPAIQTVCAKPETAAKAGVTPQV